MSSVNLKDQKFSRSPVLNAELSKLRKTKEKRYNKNISDFLPKESKVPTTHFLEYQKFPAGGN